MSEDLPGLIEFMERFPDEETCWRHLRDARWGPDGKDFTCPMCGETEHWGYIQTRRRWECYECGHQASVTSQTILQDTKLDLRTWFLAAYLVFTTKKSLSSHELARKLDINQTAAWYLQQRLAEVASPNARRLFGLVTVDESYLGGKRDAEEKGRSLAKAPVLGGVEDKANSAGDLVLQHLPDATADSIDPAVEEHVDEEAVVQTDAHRAYVGFGERTGFTHEMENLSAVEEPAHEVFPWIHVVWGNLKHVVGGVHTKASRAQLQGYLDLFAYRFNHRAGLEEGLEKGLRGLVETGAVPRRELRGGEMAEVY